MCHVSQIPAHASSVPLVLTSCMFFEELFCFKMQQVFGDFLEP